MTAPCLALVDLADPDLNFEVHTDASNYALGDALLVEQKEGLYPMAYGSRKFGPMVTNYHTTEWEMLTVVDILHYF